MKFRARKRIKDYKDRDHYIDAVYRNNKAIIDKNIPNKPKANFKKMVKEYIAQGLTTKKALDIVAKTPIFRSKAERYAESALKFVKKNKKEFKHFRKLAGWTKKIDLSKFSYAGTDGKYQIYNYGDITIKIGKSPKQGVAGLQVGLDDELED